MASFRIYFPYGTFHSFTRSSKINPTDFFPLFFCCRRGVVYRGIYLPSLSGKLQDERLEVAYQKYAHRQRQKSLMLVNSADLCLKVMVLLKVLCYLDANEQDDVRDYDDGNNNSRLLLGDFSSQDSDSAFSDKGKKNKFGDNKRLAQRNIKKPLKFIK